MQTRKMSLIESLANIAIGYGVALAAQFTIYPMFGYAIRARDNIAIGVIFTVISLVRSYALRRFFNSFRGFRRGVSS